MIDEALMRATADKVTAALEAAPGVTGALLFMRDPDGPGDAAPSAVMLEVDPEHLHATAHLVGAVHRSLARKPSNLGGMVREIMTEGLERWAAGIADVVEDSIKTRLAEGAGPALRASMDLMTPEDRATAERVNDLASGYMPDVLRSVTARHIELVREAWAAEADLTASGVAALVWDAATVTTCGGDK